MPRISFDDLPDDGRLWIFPSSRPLEPTEQEVLLAEVDDFLEGWAAHGTPLRCGRSLWEDRFLLVAVDEKAAGASGCSIDTLQRRMGLLGPRMGVTLIERGPVWYRDGEEIAAVSRARFKELAAAGEVDPETPVVDTTLTRVGEARAGALERPARESWHARAFFREQLSG